MSVETVCAICGRKLRIRGNARPGRLFRCSTCAGKSNPSTASEEKSPSASKSERISDPENADQNDALKYLYDAFISYRHRPLDRQHAVWLHSALESWRTPKKLVHERQVPAKLSRVFRDEEELAASPSLTDAIKHALKCSRFLIVVCSSETPKSVWVNQEIEYFRSLGREQQILVLLIEGDHTTSFPTALVKLHRETAGVDIASADVLSHLEPFAADVRPRAKSALRVARRLALLRLLAPILGVSFDDLRQRDAERLAADRLRRMSISSIVLIVFSGLAVGWWLQLNITREEELKRRNAEQKQTNAEEAAKLAIQQQKLDEEQRELAEQREATEREKRLNAEATAKLNAERAEYENRRRGWKQYVQEMQRIPGAWGGNDQHQIRLILNSQKDAAQKSQEDLRGIEWYYWNRRLGQTSGFRTLPVFDPIGTYALAITADGRSIAVSNQNEAGVWDTATGEMRWKHQIVERIVRGIGARNHLWDHSIASSPDGHLVAAVALPSSPMGKSGGGILRVWEAESGKEVFTPGQDPQVGGRAVAFSSDGRWVIVDGKPWKAWNVATGESKTPGAVNSSSPPINWIPNIVSLVDGMRFTTFPNQEWLWPKGSPQAGLHTSGSAMFPLQGTTLFSGKDVRPVVVSLSPSGELTVIGDERVIGVNDKPSRRMLVPSGAKCVAGLKGYLAAACEDNIVRLWEPFDEVARQSAPREFRGARGQIQALTLTRQHIGCINSDGEIVTWHRSENANRVIATEKVQATTPFTGTRGDQLLDLEMDTKEQRYIVRRNLDREVIARLPPGLMIAAKFSPHGNYLACYYPVENQRNRKGWGAKMVLWNLETDREITTIPLPPGSYSGNLSLVNPFSQNDRYLAMTRGDNEVLVIECATGEVKARVNPPDVVGFSLSRDGDKLAIGQADMVQVYNVDTQSLWIEIPTAASPKLFDYSGNFLIATKFGGDPGNSDVISINLETKEVSYLYLGRGEYNIQNVGFSNDGRRIFVATDGKLVIRAIDDGALLAEIPFTGIPDVQNCDLLVQKLMNSWR